MSGDVAKFSITIIVAILVGYFALKREVDLLGKDVALMKIDVRTMQDANVELLRSLDMSTHELEAAKLQIQSMTLQLAQLNSSATDATAKLASLPYDALLQRSQWIFSNLSSVMNASASAAVRLSAASEQLSTYSSTTSRDLQLLVESARANVTNIIPQQLDKQSRWVNDTVQQMRAQILSVSCK